MLWAVGNLVARHAAEHAGTPCGVFACGVVVVFLSFGHAFVFLEVALGEGFAFEDGHEIDTRYREDDDDDACVCEDVLFHIV